MHKLILSIIFVVYLVGISLLVYAAVWVIKTVIFLVKKVEKKYKNGSEDYRKKIQNRYIHFSIHRIFSKSISISKQIDVNSYINPWLKAYFSIIGTINWIYILPIGIIRLYIAVLRPTLLWKLPTSFYDFWYLLLIFFSYTLVQADKITLAIIIAILNICFALNHILEYFLPDKKGIQKILKIPKHKLRLLDILQSWTLIILGYAVIYYSIFKINSKSFIGIESFFDSVYFSIVTITTLGYGDIVPVSFWPKLTVISEVFLGFTYVVIVLTMYLNIYAQRKFKKEFDTKGPNNSIYPT